MKLSDHEVEIFSENSRAIYMYFNENTLQNENSLSQKNSPKENEQVVHESPRILFHKRIQNY